MKNFTFILLAILFLASCTPDGSSSLEEDCLCTENYKPVFGKNGDTYSNACLAKCAGVEYSDFSPLTNATIWFDTT